MASEYTLITYNGKNEKYVGQKVRLYPDGTIKNNMGHWIERPPGSAELINSENARALSLARIEKTTQKLREAIQKAHNANMPDLVHDSAEAFAMSGAMLYEDVVLDPNKYPRDRLETWEKLGKYAGVLPSDIKNSGNNETNVTVSVSGDAVVQLLSMLSGVKSQDADVIDVDS